MTIPLNLQYGAFRFGDARIRRGLFKASLGVQIGQLIIKKAADGKMYTADVADSSVVYATPASVIAAQVAFKAVFAGIATQQRRVDEVTDKECPLATGGVWEFPLHAALGAALQSGSFFAPWFAATTPFAPDPATLTPNSVQGTNDASHAIARLHRRAEVGDTTVLVEFISSIFEGGVQAIV